VQEEKNKELNKKLRNAERRRNELLKQFSDKWHENMLMGRKKLEKVLNNKTDLLNKSLEHQEKILYKQVKSMEKANQKETCLFLNKQNFYEKTILTQMEFERKLKDFNVSINSLKERSVQKLSPEKRKDVYLQLKRKEAEEKRKKQEEEEKKRNEG
jgi:hypothetical protein